MAVLKLDLNKKPELILVAEFGNEEIYGTEELSQRELTGLDKVGNTTDTMAHTRNLIRLFAYDKEGDPFFESKNYRREIKERNDALESISVTNLTALLTALTDIKKEDIEVLAEQGSAIANVAESIKG